MRTVYMVCGRAYSCLFESRDDAERLAYCITTSDAQVVPYDLIPDSKKVSEEVFKKEIETIPNY